MDQGPRRFLQQDLICSFVSILGCLAAFASHLKPAPPSPLGSSLTPYTQLTSWFIIGCLSAVISVHQRLKKPPPGLRFPRGVLNPTNANVTYAGQKMGVRLRRYKSVLHDGLEVRRTRCSASPYDGLPVRRTH